MPHVLQRNDGTIDCYKILDFFGGGGLEDAIKVVYFDMKRRCIHTAEEF
jgi:hypothetical protein